MACAACRKIDFTRFNARITACKGSPIYTVGTIKSEETMIYSSTFFSSCLQDENISHSHNHIAKLIEESSEWNIISLEAIAASPKVVLFRFARTLYHFT